MQQISLTQVRLRQISFPQVYLLEVDSTQVDEKKILSPAAYFLKSSSGFMISQLLRFLPATVQ
jgi:hypothetical protein